MQNTTLSHLPDNKQKHIEAIVDIIHDEFDRVVSAATKGDRKNSRIVLILLFGSYARGNWVGDPKSGYISDYDILIVLNDPAFVEEYKIWHTVEERATIKTNAPVNIIAHTLRQINQELKHGHYFFKDIREQAIQLYQYDHAELLLPGDLNTQEAKKIAQKHYDHWFHSGSGFFKQYQYAMNDNELQIAAFQLHQVVERFLSCIILVFSSYRPKSHNIKMLYSLAQQQTPALANIFPQEIKPILAVFNSSKKPTSKHVIPSIITSVSKS